MSHTTAAGPPRGRTLLILLVVLVTALLGAVGLAWPAAARAERVARPIEVVTVHAPGGRTYVLKVWAVKTSRTCLPHAYGAPVRHYLRTHDCRGVTRVLATTTVNGRGVGFAQSSTSFGGANMTAMYEAAGRFRTLVSKDGTGNFYSLFHDGYSLPRGPQHVPDPDAFTALAQDNGVTIVDAWYLRGRTPEHARPLVRLAQDIYLQWSA